MATFDEEFRKKRVLFKGDSCFPLSPYVRKDNEGDGKSHIVSALDQLKVIVGGLEP